MHSKFYRTIFTIRLLLPQGVFSNYESVIRFLKIIRSSSTLCFFQRWNSCVQIENHLKKLLLDHILFIQMTLMVLFSKSVINYNILL